MIPCQELEDSVVEPADADVTLPDNNPIITFRVIDGGSKRCKDKLVDSLGYSYTIKRRLVRLTCKIINEGIWRIFTSTFSHFNVFVELG